jgi:hypothetical protein
MVCKITNNSNDMCTYIQTNNSNDMYTYIQTCTQDTNPKLCDSRIEKGETKETMIP